MNFPCNFFFSFQPPSNGLGTIFFCVAMFLAPSQMPHSRSNQSLPYFRIALLFFNFLGCTADGNRKENELKKKKNTRKELHKKLIQNKQEPH